MKVNGHYREDYNTLRGRGYSYDPYLELLKAIIQSCEADIREGNVYAGSARKFLRDYLHEFTDLTESTIIVVMRKRGIELLLSTVNLK